jgi:large subunit ribosomal protein L6
MSRIGNLPIEIPAGVEINITDYHKLVAKGPKGELTQEFNKDLKIKIEDGILTVIRPTDQKRHRAMHGLYRSLINNMIIGVSTGYKKQLILTGVGYRASATGQILELNVGYSHPVFMVLPPEVKVSTETKKGKEPVISLESIDKQLIGQVAAKIRAVRKPEPYKGKGIRLSDEVIRRKAGKTAAK